MAFTTPSSKEYANTNLPMDAMRYLGIPPNEERDPIFKGNHVWKRQCIEVYGEDNWERTIISLQAKWQKLCNDFIS